MKLYHYLYVLFLIQTLVINKEKFVSFPQQSHWIFPIAYFSYGVSKNTLKEFCETL